MLYRATLVKIYIIEAEKIIIQKDNKENDCLLYAKIFSSSDNKSH